MSTSLAQVDQAEQPPIAVSSVVVVSYPGLDDEKELADLVKWGWLPRGTVGTVQAACHKLNRINDQWYWAYEVLPDGGNETTEISEYDLELLDGHQSPPAPPKATKSKSKESKATAKPPNVAPAAQAGAPQEVEPPATAEDIAQAVVAAPWLQEFLDSAIDLEVAQENAFWLDGPEAVVELLQGTMAARQRVRSYITTGNSALRGHYDFMEAGAWFARPAIEVAPYAKPHNPRTNPEKPDKSVKYETPPDAEAEPLFPHLGTAVKASWGVSTWAEVLVRPDIPVIFTEGWKKALALISQGYPAIALRGVTQWHGKNQRELWPEMAQVAAAGRIIATAYDQDERASTRAKVSRQARLLGNAIERAGGTARFIVWPLAIGKGIDDALAALPPEQRRGWVDALIKQAKTPAQYRRIESIARSWSILGSKLPQAQRETTGEYLPKLPLLTPGAIHWLDANMGSGKTYRMGRDWVRPWADAGGITVVLSPLNSLGQQTGEDWKLPHIHDYSTDAENQRILQGEIDASGGLVACENSAHRLLSLIPKDRPLLLVVDEAAQVFTDAAEGGTLQSEWAARWEDAIALMQRAAVTGAIALAEAGLDADTIALVETLSGAAQTVGIRHRRTAIPWPVQLHRATPASAWRGDILARLAAGERILYVTTSQKEGRRLERAARAAGISVAHRIDSETNEGGHYRAFFKTPEVWLYQAQPQLLILSPSAKTGLSIEGNITVEGAYFDSVWGYFPSLDTDTAMQLLGRYRPAVPRHVWAPAYIAPEPGEGPSQWCANRNLEQEATLYATYGGFEQAPADSQDSAIKNYLAARRQRRWAQKIQPAEVLADALRQAGHQVEVITSGIEPNEAIAAQWDAIKEQLAKEDSDYHARLEINPDTHTLDWAIKIQRGVNSSREQRCTASKVRVMARFPGLDWNQSQLWYDAVFCPRQSETNGRPSAGPMAPGAALWAEAEHYQALWEGDAKEAAQILTQRLKAAHLLPQAGPRAMLAKLFRSDIEMLLKAGTITPGGKAEARVKATALKHSAELRRYWRLNVSADQSDTAIAGKVARKFGLILSRLQKVRVNGSQQWIYGIEATETWRQLVAARQAALTGTNLLKDSLNKSVPLQPPSDSGKGGAAPPTGAQGVELPPLGVGGDHAAA
ncbi:DUF3854 domain-containing protein [Nodosilinea sp. FACHB-13]|uniref:DUF3854 domain-containing protein n=1 Tax=Cyanophyceae TaxID=3028117 RepID=UPI001685A727|nr:DUF3854 domain-containing protein [Nodosilinea sp. FACHB-13]MBD2106711.1 DUF3854 domain-containing protein [Nodosilinea sp. FACHB-13]